MSFECEFGHISGVSVRYTFIISFAVWLLKGFLDQIPREYEEAAPLHDCTRFQAFYKVVLAQAVTGMAITAFFRVIFAWIRYAPAVLPTSAAAQTDGPSVKRPSASAVSTGRTSRPRLRYFCCRS